MVIIGHRSSKSTFGANSSLAYSCLHDPVIIDRLSFHPIIHCIDQYPAPIGSQTIHFLGTYPWLWVLIIPCYLSGFLRVRYHKNPGFRQLGKFVCFAPQRVGSTLSTREHWLSTDCRFYFPPSANVPVTPALHRPIGPQITAKKRKRIWFSFFFCDRSQPNGTACFLQVHVLETGGGVVNYLVRNWSSGTCGCLAQPAGFNQ